MRPAWLHTLEKLAREGELAASQIPRGIRRELELWGERSGALRGERQGRGSVVRVVNPAILQGEIGKLRPMEESAALSLRAQNLARFADTKVGESLQSCSYVLGKILGDSVQVLRSGENLNLVALSSTLGCFALPVYPGCLPWQSQAPLLLVENQALLDHTHWISPSWEGTLLYYQGNLSERLLEWIARGEFPSVTLFPDYDGMGLTNYARLRTQVPFARWYWRTDWQEALERFGNAVLWQKEEQRRQVESLYAQWEECGYPDLQLRHLIQRMRECGKMLEQEWVLC